VLVLDRPNPINGMTIEDNCLNPDWSSFVGRYPLPMRHGLTMGELARLLGRDERVHILLFGGPEEQGLREAIEKDSQLPASRILDAGNLPILEVAALMERLDGFVCNDALLTHVAAAVNIPTVVIQGPLPHWSTRPYACRKYKVVRLDLPCSPCYGYAKYGIRCTNRMRVQCLKEITPQQVAAALKELTDAP